MARNNPPKFKIKAMRTIDDPHERRRRLAALFAIFEQRPGDTPVAGASDAPPGQGLTRQRRGKEAADD